MLTHHIPLILLLLVIFYLILKVRIIIIDLIAISASSRYSRVGGNPGSALEKPIIIAQFFNPLKPLNIKQ
jgi:hypothetical protein